MLTADSALGPQIIRREFLSIQDTIQEGPMYRILNGTYEEDSKVIKVVVKSYRRGHEQVGRLPNLREDTVCLNPNGRSMRRPLNATGISCNHILFILESLTNDVFIDILRSRRYTVPKIDNEPFSFVLKVRRAPPSSMVATY